jgi:polar amino acid transport system substrate-binding protein
MIRRLAMITLAVTALFAASCSTFSGKDSSAVRTNPVLEGILESGVLRVGLTGTQPPFNMKTRAGQIIGIDADLANALAESIGVRAEFVELPFGQLLSALEGGRVDIILSGMTMTPKRNTLVAFAGPYFVSGKAILTKSEKLAAADDPGDINRAGITLTALAGSTSEEFVTQVAPSAKLIGATDYDQAVRLVIDGGDLPICVISLLRNPDAGLTTLASPFTFEPIGAAIPAHDPLFMNLVQNYMDMLDGFGLMEALRVKWFTNGSWLAELP